MTAREELEKAMSRCKTDATDIVENDHVDPEQVAEKQAAASKKQAAHCSTKLKLRPRLVSRRGRPQS